MERCAVRPSPLDVRRPVVEPVVLGGRRELDVLGGEVDDAVVRAAGVVSAGSAVVVIVGADPAAGIDLADQLSFEVVGSACGQFDSLLQMSVLGTAGDNHLVAARRQLHGKATGCRVVLIDAAVGAVGRSEVGFLGAVDGVELCLAGNVLAGSVGNVESHLRGLAEPGIEGGGRSGTDFDPLAPRGAADVFDAQLVVAYRQRQGNFSFVVRVRRKLGVADGDQDSTAADAGALFVENRAPQFADRSVAAGYLAERRRRGCADCDETSHRHACAGGERLGTLRRFVVRFESPCIAAFVSRIDGIDPIDAVPLAARTELGIDVSEIVAGDGLVAAVGGRAGDEHAGLAVAELIDVANFHAAVFRRRGEHLDAGRLGPATCVENAHIVDRPALIEGTESGDLIVVGVAQSEIVEAAGSDAVGPVEGAHVGAAQGQVAGDHRFDFVVAEHEVADDRVGLLAADAFGSVVVCAELECLGGSGGGRGMDDREDDREQGEAGFHLPEACRSRRACHKRNRAAMG